MQLVRQEGSTVEQLQEEVARFEAAYRDSKQVGQRAGSAPLSLEGVPPWPSIIAHNSRACSACRKRACCLSVLNV